MYKDRHARVEKECEYCGEKFMARVERVKNGQGRFCSLKCANAQQKQDGMDTWGYENGKKYWDGTRYQVQWHDKDGQHGTTYANWWWNINVGEIPDGHCVIHVDGDYSNISPDNFALELVANISRSNGSKSDTTSYGFLGKKHSDNAKRIMSEKRTGKSLSDEHKRNIGKSVKMRWERGDFDNTVFVDISGDKNPGWRGGVSQEYPEGWNRKLKKFIWERDNSVCQICGKYVSPNGDVGHVHHIDGHKENLEYDNLILLCQTCHTKIHKSKDVSSPVIMAFREKLYWNQ